jgi:hypothetical protein
MKIALDEKVMEAMVTILESNVGYQISLVSDLLQLYQLHDLRFAVNRYEYDPENPSKSKWIYEELFDNARDAVEFFEQKRREYELGDDIAEALMREDEINQNK